MEESEDNMSAEEIKFDDASFNIKPKKRSLVERQLETSLTARVTSPITNRDASSTSRYGRTRRLKSDAEFCDPEKVLSKPHKSPKLEKSPNKIQSPVYKMHASNSPIRIETPKRDLSLENQIENIYNENKSLSRFGSEEKASKSATKKFPKVYIRKDLIQGKEKESDAVVLIKNIFSPSQSMKKPNSHLSNYLERSAEKYNLKNPLNGYLNTSSVVKTLDFDGKKKKKDEPKKALTKSDIFDLEAKCEYQVGDLAWARMGTYPFWPCIITRDPLSGMFVKKKMYGRLERDVLHVTFFGDNGRRGWIVGSMLRKFFGQLEFETARKNFAAEAKKKDPRLYAAFFISEKKTPQWQISVEEAEMLLREPKRLRIDILNNMLQKSIDIKTTPKLERSKKIARTNSDVSLSESLLDTLFSEDDSKGNDQERSRSKSRNRSLDVSEVVTACLDNMAAKTGITKIQRQSHMDRWLQKAKSKTPEKSHLKSHLIPKLEKDNKVSNSTKLKKKLPKKSPPKKPYSFRKFAAESQYEIDIKLPPHQNEHNYSQKYCDSNAPVILDDIEIEYENAEIFTSDVVEPGSGLGIISKVETLCGKEQTDSNDHDNLNIVVTDEFTMDVENNAENIDNIEHQVQRNEDQREINQEEFIDKEETDSNDQDEVNVVVCDEFIMSVENNCENFDNIEHQVQRIEDQCEINQEQFIDKDQTDSSDQDDVEDEFIMNAKNNGKNIYNNERQKQINEDQRHINQEQFVDEEQTGNNNVNIIVSDKFITSIDNVEHQVQRKENRTEINQEHFVDNEQTDSKITSYYINAQSGVTGDDFMSVENNVKNNDNIDYQVQTNEGQKEIDKEQLIKVANHLIFEKECDILSVSTNESEIIETEPIKIISIESLPNIKVNSGTENLKKSQKFACNDNLNEVITPEDSSCDLPSKNCLNDTNIDNGSLNVCKPHIETAINGDSQMCVNYLESTVDQDISLVDAKIATKIVMDENNFCKNLFTDDISNGLDTDISEKAASDAENAPQIALYTCNDNDSTNFSTECMEVSHVVKVNDYDDTMENLPNETMTLEQKKRVTLKSDILHAAVTEQQLTEDKIHNHVENNDIDILPNNESLKSKSNLFLQRTDVDSVSISSSSVDSKDNAENKNNENDLVGTIGVTLGEKEHADVNAVNKDGSVNIKDSALIRNKIPLPTNLDTGDISKINDCTLGETEENRNRIKQAPQNDACVPQLESASANQCNDDNAIEIISIADSEESLERHQLMETEVIGNNLDSDSNDKMTLKYEDSESSTETNLGADCKRLKDPEFIKYFELKQDTLIDEHPDLTQEEAVKYLYKTWLYEESLKSDIKKIDDIQNATLINDLKQSPIKIKLSLNGSSKKNKKIYKVQITDYFNENVQSIPASVNKSCEYVMKNKVGLMNIGNNKKDNCVNDVDPSQKKSKRVKRNSHRKKYLEKEISRGLANDCDTVIESTCKESDVKERDICQSSNEVKTNNDENTCKDVALASVGSKTLIQNDYENDEFEKKLSTSENSDYLENLLPKVNELITQDNCHKGKPKALKLLLADFDPDSDSVNDYEEPQEMPQLRLTFCKKQSGYVAEGDLIKDNTSDVTEIKYEVKIDEVDSVSVKSECSEDSYTNKKLHTKNKLTAGNRKYFDEPDFLKYLELKQDALIEDHPELTEEEITNYLYKTWLYEESSKNDIKKADDIGTVTNFVKGLNNDAAPVKKVRKRIKVEKEKQKNNNLQSEQIAPKEKSKRKIIKPYYKEDFSDLEDDIVYFEIFKPKSQTSTPTPQFTDANKDELQRSEVELIDDEINFVSEEIDEVEEYFRQLTIPKPNLFKGLLREKVCEICEKVGNLVKCKGCHGMFHIECVNKKIEVVEVAIPVRGRKKKRKTRGRKAKDHASSLDSEDQSDEKSQDPNSSVEIQNTSIENELEFNVVVNEDDFENQLSLKMKELLENPENNLEYESYSSGDELDWNDIDYGECKVVDVIPRKKDRTNSGDYSDFKCKNCQQYDIPVCFVCKLSISPKNKAEHRQKCQVAHCHKYYHLECLDHWPQTQFIAGELSRIHKNSNEFVEALTCPRHVCHTCVCDDPRGCKTRFSGDKLARCIRCPATYHTFTKCLPAGSQILTASHIICPRHYEHRPGKVPCHVNTGWCFICALGGTLICCEYCPTSFHAECLNINPPEGGYMCEDCETGRLPLYGEMVWVKLGHYRWWPGLILHPTEIPLNIFAVKHSQGEFVVRFFGQYDYYWVNRGRVFPFQEGDSGKISSQKSKIDAAFTMAMEHAQRACEILKTASPNEEESIDIASSLLPPHYVKLKVNKPCGSLCGKKIDIEESSLTQCECDPNYFDPCGPYTQCLNRMLLTECGPACRAGDRCNNRALEKRLYPKMTPYRTPHRGWGLKSLEDIRAGQFVIEYVGELIDEEEFERRLRRKYEVRDENFYYLRLDKERMIDAGPKGNLARFMNHSCEPNCETQKWTVLGDVRVGLFALYDIPANSELTFNYNLKSTGIEKKQCMCGAKRCSGYIGAKPKQDDQPKKIKPPLQTKRTYKKRKNTDISPPNKPKQRLGRPMKPKELTEIEKDLLIIKNATNGVSSDSENSRLSVDSKESRGLKRRRTVDTLSPSTKKFKTDKVEVD